MSSRRNQSPRRTAPPVRRNGGSNAVPGGTVDASGNFVRTPADLHVGDERGEPGPAPRGGSSELAELAGIIEQAGWRPMCAQCVNDHKLAIAAQVERLGKLGHQPGTQEFQAELQRSLALGELAAQSPGMAAQVDPALMIPPVRPADLMVNGNTLCHLHFVPVKQSNLIAAPASSSLIAAGTSNWRP